MVTELRTIPGFPDYAVTRDGRVWSKPRLDSRGERCGDRWLKPEVSGKGCLQVRLFLSGKRQSRMISRLVLEAWVGPHPDGMECRHLDGDPTNNNLSNLKWGTRSETMRDSIQHGTRRETCHRIACGRLPNK